MRNGGKGTPGGSWSPEQYQDYVKKQKRGRESKFGAIPTETKDGSKFDSHVEAMYYNRCLLLQQAGEIVQIEQHVRYEFHVSGVYVGAYELDFRVTYRDGTVEHVDTKSKATLTPLYRLKKALMRAVHGIEVVEKYEKDFQ